MSTQQNGTININEFTLDEKPKKLSKIDRTDIIEVLLRSYLSRK